MNWTCPHCRPLTCKIDHINILEDPQAWARAHYEAGLGSMSQLMDFAKRYRLMTDLRRTMGNEPAVIAAFEYLFGMGGKP